MAPSGKETLELYSTNPFCNLPESFFVYAHGKSYITLAGFAEAVAGCRNHSGFFEQLRGKIGRGQPFGATDPDVKSRARFLALQPGGAQAVNQDIAPLLVNVPRRLDNLVAQFKR